MVGLSILPSPDAVLPPKCHKRSFFRKLHFPFLKDSWADEDANGTIWLLVEGWPQIGPSRFLSQRCALTIRAVTSTRVPVGYPGIFYPGNFFTTRNYPGTKNKYSMSAFCGPFDCRSSELHKEGKIPVPSFMLLPLFCHFGYLTCTHGVELAELCRLILQTSIKSNTRTVAWRCIFIKSLIIIYFCLIYRNLNSCLRQRRSDKWQQPHSDVNVTDIYTPITHF